MAPVGAQYVPAYRMASGSSNRRSEYTRLYTLSRPGRATPFNPRNTSVGRANVVNQLYHPFETLPNVPRDGTCPECGLADMTRVFPLWSKLVACVLFPFGLLAMCFNYEDRCPACNYVSPK